MSAAQDLRRAVLAAFRFVRHDIAETPDGPAQRVAFVQLQGETVMRAARWRSDGWRDHRSKPFSKPVVAWFSVEPKAKA